MDNQKCLNAIVSLLAVYDEMTIIINEVRSNNQNNDNEELKLKTFLIENIKLILPIKEKEEKQNLLETNKPVVITANVFRHEIIINGMNIVEKLHTGHRELERVLGVKVKEHTSYQSDSYLERYKLFIKVITNPAFNELLEKIKNKKSFYCTFEKPDGVQGSYVFDLTTLAYNDKEANVFTNSYFDSVWLMLETILSLQGALFYEIAPRITKDQPIINIPNSLLSKECFVLKNEVENGCKDLYEAFGFEFDSKSFIKHDIEKSVKTKLKNITKILDGDIKDMHDVFTQVVSNIRTKDLIKHIKNKPTFVCRYEDQKGLLTDEVFNLPRLSYKSLDIIAAPEKFVETIWDFLLLILNLRNAVIDPDLKDES